MHVLVEAPTRTFAPVPRLLHATEGRCLRGDCTLVDADHAGLQRRRHAPDALDDPRMDPSTPGNPPMPFDGKRMIFGGFEQVVEVKA